MCPLAPNSFKRLIKPSIDNEILADFYKVDKKDIPYDNKKAFILLKKTKEEE